MGRSMASRPCECAGVALGVRGRLSDMGTQGRRMAFLPHGCASAQGNGRDCRQRRMNTVYTA